MLFAKRSLMMDEPERTHPSLHMPPHLFSYLLLIHNTPGIPATRRDHENGIRSPKKGVAYRRELKRRKLIYEVPATTGANGENFKDIRLTDKALSLLEKSR